MQKLTLMIALRFKDSQKALRTKLASPAINLKEFQRELKRCSPSTCLGWCCYDGALGDEERECRFKSLTHIVPAMDFMAVHITGVRDVVATVKQDKAYATCPNRRRVGQSRTCSRMPPAFPAWKLLYPRKARRAQSTIRGDRPNGRSSGMESIVPSTIATLASANLKGCCCESRRSR
jgi:hypothetical protein